MHKWTNPQIHYSPENSFFISAQMDQATVAWSSCAQKSRRMVYGFNHLLNILMGPDPARQGLQSGPRRPD